MLRESSAGIVVVSFLVVFLVLLIPRPSLLAAPLPPELVVNHETKECAEILGGDECMACNPPEGWETVGFAHKAECPADYARIEGIQAECGPLKDEFCCSEGHSGVHGDCEDLVVHKKRKQCAFVEDIHSTVLPEGWGKKREGLAPDRWFCPKSYQWVESLDISSNAGLDSTPEAARADSGRTSLPCFGAVLIGPVVLGLWFSKTRHQ